MDFENQVGKKVRNVKTGKIRTVLSYCDGPSVDLIDGSGNWYGGFKVGSPNSQEWEPYEDNWNFNGWISSTLLSSETDPRGVVISQTKILKQKILEDVMEAFATTPGAEFQGPVENKIKGATIEGRPREEKLISKEVIEMIINRRFGL